MLRRSFLLNSGAAALSACATGRAPRDFALSRDLDGAITRAMARLAVIPGLAVAVYSREGKYARAFGVTNVETNEAADADTSFYIASTTKPLTALAFAMLDARGELDLDQTIAEYAPDAHFPDETRPGEVRLRNLLTHTSGIDNNPLGFRVAFSGQHDPATLWRLLAESNANSEAPLGQFDYTNVGYNIATVMSDRRLGVRWQDLLQRELFDPLGMTRTSARMSRAVEGGWKVAKPHSALLGGAPRRLYLEKTDQTMQSAGGVIMSANDATRWLELLVEDGRVGRRQVVAPEVVQSTRAPLAAVASEEGGYQREHYGLGWHMGAFRDGRLYHHFGGFAGARSHVSHIPSLGVGVAAFVNDSGGAGGVTDAIANYVYDRIAGRIDAEQAFDAAIEAAAGLRDMLVGRVATDRANRAARPWTLTRPYSAYAGAYESERMGRIEIALEAERLVVRLGVLRSVAEAYTRPDSLRVELVPESGSGIDFQGDAEAPPSALTYMGETFIRV